MIDLSAPNALLSVEEAQQQLERANARLLVMGEDKPTKLPPGAAFVEASTFRDGPTRNVAGPLALERLCARCGIAEDTLVIFADADAGPHAALAFWTFALYGHARLGLLDGGLPAWESSERTLSHKGSSEATDYLPGPPDFTARATRQDVRQHLEEGAVFLDVRSPAEFSGALVAPADAPQEGIRRGGHLPGALNVPWTRALRTDGTFQPPGELAARYQHAYDLSPSTPVIAYSRTAARACHTWFVCTRLLGFDDVRVYDGGWAEWGNLVGAPIA